MSLLNFILDNFNPEGLQL